MYSEHDLCYLCTELKKLWDFLSFISYSWNKPWDGQMIWEHDFVILVHLNSWRYEIFEVFPHTFVISRKTVKWAQNTICDTCALNSRRYEIFEFFAHTVVRSWKTVKVSGEHNLWYLCTEIPEIWDCWSFSL